MWCGVVWYDVSQTYMAHTHRKTKQDIYVVADSANLFSGAQMVDGKRNMDIKGAYMAVYCSCVCVRGDVTWHQGRVCVCVIGREKHGGWMPLHAEHLERFRRSPGLI